MRIIPISSFNNLRRVTVKVGIKSLGIGVKILDFVDSQVVPLLIGRKSRSGSCHSDEPRRGDFLLVKNKGLLEVQDLVPPDGKGI